MDANAVMQSDPVNQPHHYQSYPIEPILFITANKLGFIEGNVVKYICRWRMKDGIQDLKKARRYIDMLIKYEERQAADPLKKLSID